jgi:hypothetical protein
MQIALPGSLHRVIVWLCTPSQLSTTAEAHDADRPAGLAASCHRVAVHSLTAIHHSRGTRCRSPCRARCIVSSSGCALTHSYPPQSRRTMQIALPGSLHRVAVGSVPAFSHVRAICTCVRVPPASGAVTSLASRSADQPFFEKAPSTGWHMLQFALVGSLHAVCNLRQFASPRSLGAGTLPFGVVVGARAV